MKPSEGIHAHPKLKLGRRKSQKDPRTLRFADLLRAPLATPAQYDFDVAHESLHVPTPMFANDQFGCCVMAGRAHQTLRFEGVEQNKIIPISDSDVITEYFSETGGQDSGLDPMSSFKAWRSKGWVAAGRRYFIRAFAELDPTQHDQVAQAIYMDVGVGMGLNLPLTAQTQVEAGMAWDVTGSGRKSAPGSWGGHYVFVCGYTPAGPVCVTWGQKQQMTWAFVDQYSDEAYTLFDANDTLKMSQALDLQKLGAFLKNT